jgi:hypothetical protein
MIMVLIYSVVLIVCLWVMAMQDAISRWIDEARFEEESRDDFPDLDNSEYDWGHNVKGYKYEDE